VEVDGGKQPVEEPRDSGSDIDVGACDVVVQLGGETRQSASIIHVRVRFQDVSSGVRSVHKDLVY